MQGLRTVAALMVGLALAVSPAFAQGQDDLVSPHVDDAGLLNDQVWSQAAVIEELVTLGAMVEPPQDHTQARVMHDDDAIYISVHAVAEEADEIPRLALDDQRIYQHERIELFLDEQPWSEGYFQIVVDRGGNIRATHNAARNAEARDIELSRELDVAVAEVDDGWTMQITIPFAALEAETPEPGDLYRLKVCRDGGRDGPLAWPPNPTSSFHIREADGALYFETMDILFNGDFEEGEVDEHLPPGWSAGMTSDEVDNAPQGTVETIEGAGVDGGRAVRKTKLISALWWPQIWSQGYELEPGAHYEFSLMVRGTLPTVNLRASAYSDGRRVMRLSQSFDVPEEWERLRYYFGVPHEAPEIRVGLSAPNMISGEVYYDKAMLRKVLRGADGTGLPPVATYEADPDQYQGLDAVMERQGHKPWDLYARGDELLTRRTIFQDREFGTYVWMMDDSHTVEHGGTASVWPAWNADGSLLYLSGTRVGPEGREGGWFINEDYSRLIRYPEARRPSLDRENPDVGFIHRSGELTEANLRTGESRVVAEWEPYPRERVYGLTRDNRYIFLDTPNGGLWVTYEPDPNDPIPQWGLHDGRPEAPDEDGNMKDPHEADTILNLSRHTVAETAEWGHIFRVRVGLLIDRETGEIEKVIAPINGHEAYLRAFISDRVNLPSGGIWDDYRLHTSDDIDELFEIYRYYPIMTHGHESESPDGEYTAKDGGPTIFPTRGGDPMQMRLSPNGGNYHLHWMKHPRFFIGWVRGWSFGSYMRPMHANHEFQVFSDLTSQPIVDTKHLFNGYYSGGDFSMQSPDQTKIHYGSSMTGRFKNYVAVMARPRAPQDVTWQADGGAVALTWEPPAYSRETRGYLVYRSEQSGDGYELLTPEPVEATTWRDETVEAGEAYYYVLTSIEHSGLESGYSAEVARAGVDVPAEIDEPLVVYAEPEAAIKDLYTTDRPGLAMGVDRWEASDWYFIYRHPDADEGAASIAVDVPAAGDYHLWARVRSSEVERTTWTISAAGEAREVAIGESDWTWLRAGDDAISLPAGQVEFTFATPDPAAQLDLICLATDAGFEPQGPRPEKTTPPSAVGNLTVGNVRERVNHLTWEAPDDPTVSYYQVYASEEPIEEVAQELLVGSPTEPEMYDWGLKAGTTYHYAVTAVDRRGNESAIATAQVATPPGEPMVMIELTFDEAEREGAFEQSEAGGTHGEYYVVPEAPERNAAEWEIEVPRDDEYYLWLRYLHRGSGGRGSEARQNVRALIDGEQVTSLGGGLTDLHVPDALIAEDHPLADRVWTWAWPGSEDLTRVTLPAGTHTLRLEDLAPEVRYDALVITSEPTWRPEDG
ncbi:MAG: fibronectin type III domain-containing protein, partial [Armatimonadota bacterium]